MIPKEPENIYFTKFKYLNLKCLNFKVFVCGRSYNIIQSELSRLRDSLCQIPCHTAWRIAKSIHTIHFSNTHWLLNQTFINRIMPSELLHQFFRKLHFPPLGCLLFLLSPCVFRNSLFNANNVDQNQTPSGIGSGSTLCDGVPFTERYA